MIPASALFDQSTLSALLEHDPLVSDYRAFFPCSIGPSLKHGKLNALRAAALLILKLPT